MLCGSVFCREADMTKERIQKLLKAGANVVLTTKGIDDMALKVCFSLPFSPSFCCLECPVGNFELHLFLLSVFRGGWGDCCETCAEGGYAPCC